LRQKVIDQSCLALTQLMPLPPPVQTADR
jgi:hypothetical protein